MKIKNKWKLCIGIKILQLIVFPNVFIYIVYTIYISNTLAVRIEFLMRCEKGVKYLP